MTRFSQSPFGTGGAGQPGSLLGRAFAFIIGIIVLAASVFLGALFFAALLGLILILAVIFMIRIWWVKRKMRQYVQEHGDLDAEYTVIQEGRREIHHESYRDTGHKNTRDDR